ncbi:lipase member K-like, partial [Asbolus verrucosus]
MVDYRTIDDNKNCWYNPDVGSSVEQLITRRGYPFESYEITTEDGYINIMYRIPHNNTNHNSTRQPVLLHPGFSGSPLTFLTIGNRSLAFFLVNNGFDVWLPNRRGIIVNNSQGHLYLKRTDKEFWDYSFHESGYYDIKAEVDFIANQTEGAGKIIYIGYSMGTTESYIYASLRKEHANKHIAGIISLAPVAFMKHLKGVLAKVAPYSSFLEADLSAFIKNGPVSTSVKTLVHFSQEMHAGGNFQHYDYGPAKNVLLYDSNTPPSYNLSEIEVPVHLFCGDADLIADKEDVLMLYNKLTVKNKSLIAISPDKNVKFSHADFALAKNIRELLHEVLLKTINENLR